MIHYYLLFPLHKLWWPCHILLFINNIFVIAQKWFIKAPISKVRCNLCNIPALLLRSVSPPLSCRDCPKLCILSESPCILSTMLSSGRLFSDFSPASPLLVPPVSPRACRSFSAAADAVVDTGLRIKQRNKWRHKSSGTLASKKVSMKSLKPL